MNDIDEQPAPPRTGDARLQFYIFCGMTLICAVIAMFALLSGDWTAACLMGLYTIYNVLNIPGRRGINDSDFRTVWRAEQLDERRKQIKVTAEAASFNNIRVAVLGAAVAVIVFPALNYLIPAAAIAVGICMALDISSKWYYSRRM
jgi:uncharacterized membrane protein